MVLRKRVAARSARTILKVEPEHLGFQIQVGGAVENTNVLSAMDE
jgi:hypothetical protein